MTHFNASSLNRLGPFRTNIELLKTLFSSDLSKILFFNEKLALFNRKNGTLGWMKTSQFSFLKTELLFEPSSNESRKQQVVFLGCKGLESNYKNPETKESFWAIETSSLGADHKECFKALESEGYEFRRLGDFGFSLDPEEASILGQASAIISWNSSHQYCSSCGGSTISDQAGYKRKCVNIACLTNSSASSISYPRTDACVIVCISSENGKKLLLGRKAEWPQNRYSCFSGFLEPAESVESAAKREVVEESGVIIDNIKYFGSQAWPFPSKLMLGFSATTASTEIIKTDKEMEDIKWFSKEDVIDAINKARYSSTHEFGSKANTEESSGLILPPPVSIAHELIKNWASQ